MHLAKLSEQKTELLTKVQTLKRELLEWRTKLDGQVQSFRGVSLCMRHFNAPCMAQFMRPPLSVLAPVLRRVSDLLEIAAAQLPLLAMTLRTWGAGNHGPAAHTEHRGGLASERVPRPQVGTQASTRAHSGANNIPGWLRSGEICLAALPSSFGATPLNLQSCYNLLPR